MTRPTLTYASSTGSNANSGAGPATSVTGSNAYSGDGAGGGTQTVINVSGDSPDLSGIATDGSAALYLDIGNVNARHLFRITDVDDSAKTITVADAPDSSIDTGSEVAWGVGGKRATMTKDANRYDWRDMQPGWTFAFENEQQLLPGVAVILPDGDVTNGPVTWISADPASYKPEIRQTDTAHLFEASSYLVIDSLDLGWTDDEHRSVCSWSASRYGFVLRNCILRGGTSYILFFNGQIQGVIEDNELIGNPNSIRALLQVNTGRNYLTIRRNVFRGGPHEAIEFGNMGTLSHPVIWRNLIYDCDTGIDLSKIVDVSDATVTIAYNTIDNIAGDGINLNEDTPVDRFHLYLEGNAITNCGGYGVNAPANFHHQVHLNRNNHYHANTSGNWNNSPLGGTTAPGIDDQTGDPMYVSTTPGSEDYTKAAGSPLIGAGPLLRTGAG
jgi:hypothetical protein